MFVEADQIKKGGINIGPIIQVLCGWGYSGAMLFTKAVP